MTEQKRDRMAGAACTRAALAACTDDDVRVVASTALTNRKGFWAVTTVKPISKDVTGGELVATLFRSSRLLNGTVRIEGSWLGNTVKVWWKV